jgi:hypothetical protein
MEEFLRSSSPNLEPQMEGAPTLDYKSGEARRVHWIPPVVCWARPAPAGRVRQWLRSVRAARLGPSFIASASHGSLARPDGFEHSLPSIVIEGVEELVPA